jgi:hypothetical protein
MLLANSNFQRQRRGIFIENGESLDPKLRQERNVSDVAPDGAWETIAQRIL